MFLNIFNKVVLTTPSFVLIRHTHRNICSQYCIKFDHASVSGSASPSSGAFSSHRDAEQMSLS